MKLFLQTGECEKEECVSHQGCKGWGVWGVMVWFDGVFGWRRGCPIWGTQGCWLCLGMFSSLVEGCVSREWVVIGDRVQNVGVLVF